MYWIDSETVRAIYKEHDMCECGTPRSRHGGIDGHGGRGLRRADGQVVVLCEQFTWAGLG